MRYSPLLPRSSDGTESREDEGVQTADRPRLPAVRDGIDGYRGRFVARYLRPLVVQIKRSQGWRQGEVAESVGIPAQALSDYLNGRSHPSPSRQLRLLRLGGDSRDLRTAILADKISCLMDRGGLSLEDALAAVRAVKAASAADAPPQRP